MDLPLASRAEHVQNIAMIKKSYEITFPTSGHSPETDSERGGYAVLLWYHVLSRSHFTTLGLVLVRMYSSQSTCVKVD